MFVIGGRSEQTGQKSEYERPPQSMASLLFRPICPILSRTWLYQVRGAAHIAVNSGTLALNEGCCCIVQAGAMPSWTAGPQ